MAPVTKFTPTASALSMSFNVGIVGATGAVGAEIRSVLENRGFPVEKLRIFGSERSAGSTIATEKYGDIKVELFDVDKARECDVIFLAVSGDFALEHAEAISKGDDGAVVIDNSVSIFHLFLFVFLSLILSMIFLLTFSSLPLFLFYSPPFVIVLKSLSWFPKSMARKPKNPN